MFEDVFDCAAGMILVGCASAGVRDGMTGAVTEAINLCERKKDQ